MPLYRLNPIVDCRWSEFLQTRGEASAFHTSGWLQTLKTTYGYEPIVFTTCAPRAALTNGIVLCQIRSWLTGSRWVSLPFADHCAPLYERADDLYSLLEAIAYESRKQGVGHVEIRALDSSDSGLAERTSFVAAETFKLHVLDLGPTVEQILNACDRSSVQRRLRHATREKLTYEEGIGADLLRKFYYLMVLTRRRHGVPPQPPSWFRNLVTFLGDKATIRVASIGESPIAAVLTFSHNDVVMYKYGCSDERHHKLGGMVSLFWQCIQHAKSSGAHTFDMGRSDVNNPGLIRFKANWGTKEIPLIYRRSPQASSTRSAQWQKGKQVGGAVLSRLPSSFLIAIGKTLYRHAG